MSTAFCQIGGRWLWHDHKATQTAVAGADHPQLSRVSAYRFRHLGVGVGSIKRVWETMTPEILEPRWDGPCIVAATGKSLTREVADACRGFRTIAIKQAGIGDPSRNVAAPMPWADVLYAADVWWWDHFKGATAFTGERWGWFNPQKMKAHKGVRLVDIEVNDEAHPTFSTSERYIHRNRCTGAQAIDLAMHWTRPAPSGRKRIVLVGFDMAGTYFYGQHPKGHHYGRQWASFLPMFDALAKQVPADAEIINATPKSAMKGFPKMTLEQALAIS